MLNSTMMDYQLIIPSMLERALKLYPNQEIVSVIPIGINPETKTPIPGTHRTTYGKTHPRVMQLCNALIAAGVNTGERVATMALNTFRHYELYFGVPSIGAVCHMVNIRLPADQIAYILNHAEDKILFIENVFVPMIPLIRQHAPKVKTIVVLGQVPSGLPEGVLDYETFIAGHPATFTYPYIDEHQASGMCYTSGTTGNPKGVLYSHRAIVLHSLASMASDLLGVQSRDTIMPIVPMFHVNAWGYPYTCTMAGAKQVYMSIFTDAKTIAKTLVDEHVTTVAGVPTIFLGLLEELDRAKRDEQAYEFPKLNNIVIGGSATPTALIANYAKRHGLHVTPAWGMTETTPLGAVNQVKTDDVYENLETKYKNMTITGQMAPLVEFRIIDETGTDLPWDGLAQGHLLVRGAWVTSSYYNNPEATATATQFNGWFNTGDIATINTNGMMMIQDRAKDLIKSGGEWISSVDLENKLMGHPRIKEAAVIAIPHPKWDERPLGILVLHNEESITKTELDEFLLECGVEKWQLPDAYEVIPEIPKTTVGKALKRVLRDQFKDYHLTNL